MLLIRRSGVRISLLVAILISTLCLPLAAQTTPGSAAAALQPIAQANRVAAQASLTKQTQLTGHLPAWVTADRQTTAAVDLSAPMHLSIVLRRDPAVQAAFEKLLADQQNPSSPLYRHWLTPQQMGDLYGPTSSDVAAVTGWLGAQGLTVDSVAPSRVIIEVSGSTAKVANAFRTSFAHFSLAGQPRFSATTEPYIPSALVQVISSIHGLTEVPLEPQSRTSAAQRYASPNATTVDKGQYFDYVTPNDFAVIYDIKGIYSGGNTGATVGSNAQHIAIVGRSRVAASDISAYESLAGLPNVQPNVFVPPTGVDPLITGTGDQDEATLDVDRVIGTAPGAVPDLIVATQTSGGIELAAEYNVDTLHDPIMTISFGNCEINAGATGVNYWDNLFSIAAGAGISVFVSSDDSGAAGCDTGNATPPATQALSINYICSSSYATCVGGTEFNDAANPSNYWSTTNGAGEESVKSYIPEGGWNEPTVTNSSGVVTGYIASASGGGVSTFIKKPSWQAGTGVPADGFRDVPDVAFSASSHDGYLACLAYRGAGFDCSQGGGVVFSGTSAAAPGMAGIAALLNTKAGVTQGNINPLLYEVAASTPSAFHDASPANLGVTSCTTGTPSMCNNSTPSPTSLTGGLAGYPLTTGYDQVTGLGSLDVANFLTAAVAATAPSFTLKASAATPSSIAPGATASSTINLTSTNGFAGSVALACSFALQGGGTAQLPPTCSFSSTSVSLTANGTGSSTVTIGTVAQSSNCISSVSSPSLGRSTGILFAGLLLLVLPIRKRKAMRVLATVFLMAGGLTLMTGCGNGSSTTTKCTTSTTQPTTAGTYTVTITGTSGSTSASTTFALTIS